MSNDLYMRALSWALGNDTGSSSKTLARHMLGLPQRCPMVPADSGDRGRCIRLLLEVPEWIERLDELAIAEPGRPKTVNGDPNHSDDWKHQIELIRREIMQYKPATTDRSTDE